MERSAEGTAHPRRREFCWRGTKRTNWFCHILTLQFLLTQASPNCLALQRSVDTSSEYLWTRRRHLLNRSSVCVLNLMGLFSTGERTPKLTQLNGIQPNLMSLFTRVIFLLGHDKKGTKNFQRYSIITSVCTIHQRRQYYKINSFKGLITVKLLVHRLFCRTIT